MRQAITRREFIKGLAAGAGISAVSPWSAPWAFAKTSGLVRDYDAEVPNAYADLALTLIKTTAGFSPPVASRALGCMGVALCEAVGPGMRGHTSLGGVLQEFPAPPIGARGGFHWPTVANAALATILRRLFPTSVANLAAIDSLEARLKGEFGSVPAPVRDRSTERGANVAQLVYEWSKTDGGHEGYLTNFPSSYTPPAGPGLWVPTPPTFQPIPLQPYWASNRRFATATGASCAVPPHPTYSTDPGSEFYASGFEVYDTVNNLSAEQQTIALYWADGAGTITPPGHSISMLRQILALEVASLELAAEAYLKVGCAVADAFIQCWHTKYVWNLLRPVTFIRANIDDSWTPLIATPPFPEYTSGHSTQSGAWAAVMTALFGDGYVFTDHTNDAAGFAPRRFDSFIEAAREAKDSRLYGGIHYRFGNDRGLEAGLCIGEVAAALPIHS